MNTCEGQVKPLVIWPDKMLRTECRPVENIHNEHQLIADMKRTVECHDGLGLAAPQVNDLSQVVVLRLTAHHMPHSSADNISEQDISAYTLPLINPKLAQVDDTYMYTWDEGCLSVPGYFERRQRPQRVVVQYQNEHGHEKEQEFQGLAAFVVQHELDHLNGKVFVDELSRLKQQRVKKKIAKTQRIGK